MTATLWAHGADRVLLADHPSLKKFLTLPYTRVIADLVPQKTTRNISSAGDLSRIRSGGPRRPCGPHPGLSAHCTNLDISDRGELMQVVPAFGGKVMATIFCRKTSPANGHSAAQLKRGEPQEKKGAVERVPVEIKPEDLRQKVIDVHWERRPAQTIEEAEVVVAGGAGIGNPEDWKWVERLAQSIPRIRRGHASASG